jgi:hypothetical protein
MSTPLCARKENSALKLSFSDDLSAVADSPDLFLKPEACSLPRSG